MSRECRKRMAEDGDDSGKEDKEKSVKTGAAPASVLPKRDRDLSEIETAVDNLARVNLMLEESGCGALKSYCRATFDALVRQVKFHIKLMKNLGERRNLIKSPMS